MEKAYYMAYGSNLHPHRLQQRCPSAKLLGVTRLNGFQLKFHAQGMDHSGKCNLAASKLEDWVYVAVFEMAHEERSLLDEFEGPAYLVETVNILLDDRSYDCFCYIARPEHIDEQLQPFDWYRELVLLGAQYYGLPHDYLQMINGTSCKEDSNEQRRLKQLALVKELSAFNKEHPNPEVYTEHFATDERVQRAVNRIQSILNDYYHLQPYDFDEKINQASRYCNREMVERLQRLKNYRRQLAKGHVGVEFSDEEFTRLYEELAEYLLQHSYQVRIEKPRSRLSRMTYRGIQSLGLLAGLGISLVSIVGGTYYGYRYYQFEGAFAGFLLMFLVSGLILKPVQYLFQGLAVVTSGVTEISLRHYVASSILGVLVVLGVYLYVRFSGLLPEVASARL